MVKTPPLRGLPPRRRSFIAIAVTIIIMIMIMIMKYTGVVNMMLMHILKKPYLPFNRYGHFLMSLFPVLISVKKDFKTLNEEIILIFSSLFAILLTALILTTLYMEVYNIYKYI